MNFYSNANRFMSFARKAAYTVFLIHVVGSTLAPQLIPPSDLSREIVRAIIERNV